MRTAKHFVTLCIVWWPVIVGRYHFSGNWFVCFTFFLGPDIPEVTLRSTQKDPEGREICQLKQYLPGAYEGPVVQNVTKLIKVY